MMPEKKPEAAALGKPGRTQIVGSRRETPSAIPLRLKSPSINSHADFLRPVAGLWRAQENVVDFVGKGAAKHGDGRGEHHPWHI